MRYLTTKEVSQILGCTQRNVCYLIKANKIIPAITLENGHFLITTEEVELFNSKKISDVKE
jgi:excisionase family DNA binding protein